MTTLKTILCGIVIISAPFLLAQQPEPLDLKPHHVTLSVANLDRAVKWYQEKLGLTVEVRKSQTTPPLEIAWMKMPGYRIDLIQYRGSIKPQVPTDHLLMQGFAHIVFVTASADHSYQILKSRGANPTEPSTNNEFHNRTFFLRDADGNYIEIYQEMPVGSK